jgi:hypothetical protein
VFASPFHRFFLNLQELLPQTSLYYLSKEEAHRRLVELPGQDYGYDDKAWVRWGLEHHQFLPGWEPSEAGDA